MRRFNVHPFVLRKAVVENMPSPDSERDRNNGDTTEVPLSRRTVLKTGALASGAVAAGRISGRAVAGKGNGDFRARARVVDREDPAPDTAIVLAALDIPISHWIVYGDETVADQNPTYDSGQPVVIVSFEHHLDSGWPDWRRANPNTLFDDVIERGIKFYAFPRDRLDRRAPTDEDQFSERTPVIDREDSDPDAAIVINVLDVPISDWIVYGNETVADQNQAYDPDGPVVIVAFEDRLDAGWSTWRHADPTTLFDGVVDRGIKFHAFPTARLEKGRPN